MHNLFYVACAAHCFKNCHHLTSLSVPKAVSDYSSLTPLAPQPELTHSWRFLCTARAPKKLQLCFSHLLYFALARVRLLVWQWCLLWANIKDSKLWFSSVIEGESAVGMAGAAGRPRVALGLPRELRGSGRGLRPCWLRQGRWLIKTPASVMRLPRERDNWSNCFCKFSSWYSACKAACHWAGRAEPCGL